MYSDCLENIQYMIKYSVKSIHFPVKRLTGAKVNNWHTQIMSRYKNVFVFYITVKHAHLKNIRTVRDKLPKLFAYLTRFVSY